MSEHLMQNKGKAKGMKRSKGQDEFWAAVTENGTKGCFSSAGGENFECDYWTGRPDAHHLIPKERIKSEFATRIRRQFEHDYDPSHDFEFECHDALKDPRNGIPLCRFHHSQLENHRIYITRSELPESVFDFVKDYSLESLLDRAYPERETDAA